MNNYSCEVTFAFIIASIITSHSFLFAQDSVVEINSLKKEIGSTKAPFNSAVLSVSNRSYAFMEVGQIVEGMFDYSQQIDHVWQQMTSMGLAAEAYYGRQLSMKCGAEARLIFAFPQRRDFRYYRTELVLHQAEACYSFGDSSSIGFYIRGGYFPFKYNPEVRNLGEYLFRSSAYPTILFSYFDFPMERLMGVHSRISLLGKGNIDIILNSEMKIYPLMDYSLAILGDYNAFNKIISAGAGIQFVRLLEVMKRESDFSTILEGNSRVAYRKNLRYVDTVDINGVAFVDTLIDTGYYSFSSTKLMARLCIDPKSLLKSIGIDIFGPEDLKLYGEINVIGWKDYPPLISDPDVDYSERWRRIPAMVGFNIPTFNFLDVVAYEIEWFKSKYPNDYFQVEYSGYPLPVPNAATATVTYKLAPYYWSLYFKKTFLNHLYFVAQLGRDHSRISSFENRYKVENMPGKNHWAWRAKMGFNF